MLRIIYQEGIGKAHPEFAAARQRFIAGKSDVVRKPPKRRKREVVRYRSCLHIQQRIKNYNF